METVNLRFLHILQHQGERNVVEWCMSHGLLSNNYICPKCGSDMKLSDRADIADKCEWRCWKKGDNEHYVKRSVRKGSWFSSSKMDISVILVMTYLWIHKVPCEFVLHELGISSRTLTDWRMFCREVCVELCLIDNVKIGGPGVVVEIDESKFGKRKYNRGKTVQGRWVFGGVERGSTKCFFKVVEKRSKDVLLNVIKDNILPGSVIISDCWKAYDCLSEEGFEHLKVNHSLNFKDPDTNAHTNTIEGTWSFIKRSLLGTRQVTDQFDSYLAEFIWRRRRSEDKDLFMSFVSSIRSVYQPKNCD